MLAFLQTHAPPCRDLAPGGELHVSLTAYTTPDCSDPTTRVFCSTSAGVPLPDGREDAVVSVSLACDVGCKGVCTPATCESLAKNCGTISDGCHSTLTCGNCLPPQVCGGHNGTGTPNVCSK
jgi:hypothetical protein